LTFESLMCKAEQSLKAAQVLLDSGFGDDACSRAYYAMFDAARAALTASNAPVQTETIRTHSGMIAMFNLHVIKPGILPKFAARTLGHAQQARLIADYDGEFINQLDAVQTVAWAVEFLDAVRAAFDPGVNT
jgi:uncharacterized protein (UPF0332 family)